MSKGKKTGTKQEYKKFRELPKKQKDVRFGLIYDAAAYLEDEFWSNFFIDISKGKSPKKITVDGSTIMIGSKRNMNVYYYGDKHAGKIAIDLKPLLIGNLNILSNSDLKNTTTEIGEIMNEFNLFKDVNDWKRIKNKKMRDSLLDNYILDCKIDWDLRWDQTKYLQTVIYNAFYFFRTHKSKDVEMQSGKIKNIMDIVYEENVITNKRYKLENMQDGYSYESGTKPSRKISDIWVSYIKVISDDIILKSAKTIEPQEMKENEETDEGENIEI